MSGPVGPAAQVFVHRPIVMGRRGMVVAGHHLAAEAGARVLADGGNAMDAAVTAAAALSAAIPFMNGVGGDCFALWFDAARGEAQTVNGSGGAPAAATIDAYRARGLERVPTRGPLSISVPGAPHAWAEALARFGTIPLADALGPATRIAADGLPVDRVLRDFLNGPVYAGLAAGQPALAAIFGAPGGRRLGEIVRQPTLAESLGRIAATGVGALYGGPLGAALAEDLAAAGALLTNDDLAAHRTLLQDPLTTAYRGHEVLSAPPNTQGIALSLLLALLDRADGDEPSLARFLRLKQLAFAARDRRVGDPDLAGDLQPLLSPDALASLDAYGDLGPPGRLAPGPHGGDTTTVVAMDAAGNAVSWVQSLFEEFGSGVVSPATGIVLQNRLSLASLVPGGTNSLAPGRRPFHTLCPALVLEGGRCRLAIATPGDHGQPQTIAQVLAHILEGGLDVQAAIEAPRIRHDEGNEVMYESRLAAGRLTPLTDAGYGLRDVGGWSRVMGGVCAIDCPDGGVRMGGADPRRAAYAAAE